MIFRISHRTIYHFTKPVFLEPHILRLRPRCDAFQRVDKYDLKVDPAPAGRSDGYDAGGNHTTVLWFEELLSRLEILSQSTVETLRPNPFDYLVTHPEAMNLPVNYPATDENALRPFMRPEGGSGTRDLAEELRKKSGGDALSFVNELCLTLNRDWEVIVREEGEPFQPAETLGRSSASCRDLTVLFMAVCREIGIAARFVSGYQEGDREQDERFMHAWPEVYFPGAGWRGYDPTLGLVVADRHVALASAAEAASAAPTTGTFRGTGAESAMEVSLTITTDDPAAKF